MAKPRKPGTTRSTRANAGARLKSGAPGSDKIEDAEVVSETPEEAVAIDATEEAATESLAEVEEATVAPDVDQPADKPEEGPTGAESSDADKVEEPVVVASIPEDTATAPKDEVPQPKDSATPVTDLPRSVAPAPVPPPARGGGFGQMVLGGIIAAVLGAGALYLSNSQGWITLADNAALKTTLSTQSAKIDALQSSLQTAHADIEALRVADVGIAKVNERVDGMSAVVDGVSAATVTLGTRIEETNDRITEVSTQPIPEARLPEQVTAAYEAKFAELQAALEQRNTALQTEQDAKLGAIEAKLDTRLAEMAVAQGAAVQAEEAALAAEAVTRTRAALAEIDRALDTGTSFGPALEALAETADLPETLSGLADGSTATLTQLQASFPEAARTALVAATRAEAQDGSVGGVTAFFRTQLGARSLEPREGDDPDAVLSRAEAAVKSGDLPTALTEISALPEDGQAALAGWRSQAETRIAAKAALAALADQLNSN